MRQTSLSCCMPRVSRELGYVIFFFFFVVDGGEDSGVWAVPLPQPSDVGAGLKTSNACCRGGWLLHKKHLLLIPNAFPGHPQFKMCIYKNPWHKPVPSLQHKCHVVRLILGSGLFNVTSYYPLSNQTWNFVFTDCPASLGWQIQQSDLSLCL